MSFLNDTNLPSVTPPGRAENFKGSVVKVERDGGGAHKKVNIRDIRLGMFVDEPGGNWLDHPFRTPGRGHRSVRCRIAEAEGQGFFRQVEDSNL